MADKKHIKPDLSDKKYFDDKFKEMDSETAHMHHDMRSAMHRISPRDPVSGGGDPLQKKLEKLREPVISKEDGSKEVYLKYYIGSFTLGEITVTIEDGVLHVEAKHNESKDKSHVWDTFSRQYTLPKGTDLSKMTSTLMRDGVLVIRAPVNT